MQTHQVETSPVIFSLINPKLAIPKYATAGAAGFDLQASIDAPVTLEPGEMKAIPTGLKVALQPGTELQIRPRSGLALKHSLTIMNAPGTVDCDYRGEIVILLTNLGKVSYRVEPLERIAQGVLSHYLRAEFNTDWDDEALKTDRGSGGFRINRQGRLSSNGPSSGPINMPAESGPRKVQGYEFMSQLIKPDEINLILDTETTGVSPTDGDRLVEIGIIKMRGFTPIGEAHWLINPNRPIPADATRVHGITDEMVRDAPYFEDICDRLMQFIGDYTLVIHNAEFDIRFLNEELRRCDRPILRNKVKDTLAMARRKFPGSPASLDALARRFNITNLRKTEENGRHGALIDAKILAGVWIELEGGRQSTMTFDQIAKIEEETAPVIEAIRGRRVIRANDDEIVAHAAFLQKEVKNAIWSAA